MALILGALDFPPVSHLIEWPDFALKGSTFAINKIALLSIVSVILITILFAAAGRKQALVPRGVQSLVEMGVEFVQDGIATQIMGPAGLAWMPFLTSIFFFVFFLNIWEVVPGIQMPVNARIAIPMFLALVVWITYNAIGVMKQGPFNYVKNAIVPPGVPKAMLVLVTPIEFLSKFILQPFSLAIRLFANMLAGHLLLVTFAVLCTALWTKAVVAVILPLPFLMLILLTGFEVFVAGLQAFIFTMLTAVYIDAASHAEH